MGEGPPIVIILISDLGHLAGTTLILRVRVRAGRSTPFLPLLFVIETGPYVGTGSLRAPSAFILFITDELLN